MEGTSRKKTAVAVYIVYCIYCVFMWCTSRYLNWSQTGIWICAAGMAGGTYLTFRKNFKAEPQAYFLTAFSVLNIWIHSMDMQEFTEAFTALCALACLLSFYHIPQINYIYLVITTIFILYKIAAGHGFHYDLEAECYHTFMRIACVYLVEIAMIILIKWHLRALKIVREKAAEAETACQAKADFLANMSHEIRTPMNVITGMTELMMQRQLKEEEKEYIYGIHTAGENLLAIINDILDFSKIESGELELTAKPYETMSFFYDIGSIARIQLGEKKIELIADINPLFPLKLVGDVVRLKQIILNLIGNAIKYTQEGTIIFRADFRETQKGIDLMISIKDSGIGIRKEDVERLFHAFEQIDAKRSRAVEGTGLGLAISKEIISLMGGELQFESTFGEGSHFYFTVPQAVADGEPCAVVKEKEQIHFGIYAEKESIKNSFIKTIRQLELSYTEIKENDKIAEVIKKEGINYLFLDCSQGNEIPKWLERIPAETEVLVFEDAYLKSYTAVNVHTIKRPVCSIVLAAVLNHQETGRTLYERELTVNRNRFRAPEARILIVDDNAVNLKVAKGLLNPYGMQIDEAVSGEDAIAKIMQNKYDLVLMDHMMPEMDGIEATRIIRRKPGDYYHNLPIIALSANAVHGVQKMFLEAGMNDFVAKPIEMRILADKLTEWLPKEKIITRRADEGEEEALEQFARQLEKDKEALENMRKSQLFVAEGIDVSLGLSYTEGDADLYLDIVCDYAECVESKAAEIERCLAGGDMENYTINVHALKSISQTIGALEIFKKAKELEECGKEQDRETLLRETPVLLEKYRKLGECLRTYCKQDEEECTGEQPERAQLAEKLNILIHCLEEYDSFGAEEVIEQMKKYDYEDEMTKDIFANMQESMNRFDYDSCKEAAYRMLAYA